MQDAKDEPRDEREPAGRILLVDDEQSFLEATAEMLRRHGHDCQVAPDAVSASEILEKDPVEVLVTDIRMPGNQQLEFVRRVCSEDDAPAVILVTGFPSVDTAVSSIDLRVFGYLVKPIEFDELLGKTDAAVRHVRIRRGVQALDERLELIHHDVHNVHEALRTPHPRIHGPSMQRLLAGTSRSLLAGLRDLGRLESDLLSHPGEGLEAGSAAAAPSVDLSVLSPRELEVLELIRSGYRVATVARRLFISPHTVRNHLKRIFLKLEVGSQAELLEKLKPLREG